MNYKSAEEPILYPEYGRHVQNLVKYALTIEDMDKRQSIIDGVIVLMGQILPNVRNVEEQQDRFWNHIFQISNYELGVKTPDNIEIIRIEDNPKPIKMSYPTGSARMRHYGLNVQRLVDKALKMEDKELQAEFVKIIGNYMKTAYRTWNKEHFVSDEMIATDLARLSKGAFVLEEGIRFVAAVPQSTGLPRKTNNRKGGRSGYGSRSRGGGRNPRNGRNNQSRNKRKRY